MSQLIRVAHSPDSDDAFMFYALAKDRIPTGPWRFEHVLSDIETLNQKAFKGEYEVTAVSIHAYAHLHRQYALLASGASMGDNYGPMVVTRQPMPIEQARKVSIAIPGKLTSAYLALQLCLGKDQPVTVMPFDEILPAVKEGRAQAGLLIHEGQLTYGKEGLHCVVNLGEWWHQRTGGLPLPLGGNVIRRDLGQATMDEVARLLKASIVHALEHRKEALGHAMSYARGLDPNDADRFVGMYVNDLTVDYGQRGRKAVQLFLDEAHAAGLIPEKVDVRFVG